jgi:hypothetical protein
MLPEELLDPGGVLGPKRWNKFEPVVQHMAPAPLVALVNQRLEFQHDVRFARP